MASLREIRRKIKSYKSMVGRAPKLGLGNLYRHTRSGYGPRASAQQITKAMKTCPSVVWRVVAAYIVILSAGNIFPKAACGANQKEYEVFNKAFPVMQVDKAMEVAASGKSKGRGLDREKVQILDTWPGGGSVGGGCSPIAKVLFNNQEGFIVLGPGKYADTAVSIFVLDKEKHSLLDSEVLFDEASDEGCVWEVRSALADINADGFMDVVQHYKASGPEGCKNVDSIAGRIWSQNKFQNYVGDQTKLEKLSRNLKVL